MNTRNGSPADLAITRFIKVCGALVAVYAAVVTQDAGSFAIASVMLAGGQGLENVVKGRKP